MRELDSVDSILDPKHKFVILNQAEVSASNISVLEWNTSSLDLLCTTACQAGLAALHSVSQTACSDDTFSIDDNSMSLHDLVDLIDYKWGLICLKDTSTNDYCLDVENRYIHIEARND